METAITEGIVVEAPFLSEPVEIIKVQDFADRIRIIGRGIYSNQVFDYLLQEEDIKKLKVKDYEIDFSTNGLEAFLTLEAIRYRYASLFDPLLGINVSKIDPLPFQIEAVYGFILRLPRIRFLIADDPGAGKTIMSGLIIKELKLRGLAKRILIVVPGHLKDQWRRELWEKFQESFEVIDRSTFNNTYGTNPWSLKNQVITSVDFAKREDILPSLSSVYWDLVIVDEAHKMTAYKYGNKVQRTERYKLGDVLSKTSEHLLFLTATPHRGNPESFRLFLDLLMPGFFATSELIEESLKNKDNPLFIRRLKEDLKDFEGKPIFTNRYPKTIKYRLSEKEKELYNEVSKYVISEYNKALNMDKKRNIAFALLMLQRRMSSSTYALLKSLERRKKRLEELLVSGKPAESFFFDDEVDLEDLEEKEREKIEREWEALTLSKTKEELKREINTIERLIKQAEEVLKSEEEVKLRELKRAIEEGFKKIREIGGNEKILIFTEFRDTMEYLFGKVRSWGYSATCIHGGMSLEERIKAEKEFREEKQIMVATEAAGEGINLQFCHLMINYDIPWNPNRLEQRMGRIHRYGQQKDVYIFNLVAEDTREGIVLGKILEKLEEIRKALGSDKVFDVIGDVFRNKDLYQLILEAVSNAKSMDEIIKELDIKVDENYISYIKDILGESLATRYIDYTRIKEIAIKAKEHRLIPEYVEEFFKKVMDFLGGEVRKRKDGFTEIKHIPKEVKSIAKDHDFMVRYGSLLDSYKKATFDKELAFKNPDAEFISFGHPLLEAIIELLIGKYSERLKKGAVFEDPSGRYNGIIWFFEGEVRDGTGKTAGKKILAIYQDFQTNTFSQINPAVIWDLVPKNSQADIPLANKNIDKNEPINYASYILELYKEELLEERKRQADIKRKYGIKSLRYLIHKLDEELAELYYRQAKGEDVELAIRNKEERLEQYKEIKKKLEEEIEKEQNLSIFMPNYLSAILVLPRSEDKMVSDEEIERIGMEIAMEYERSQGREPEDVSRENLGFDIRSRGENEIRYIEVKARKDEGEVALTPNEWLMAKRFKDQYWLYVVANAGINPTLYVIRNPAENLKVEEKVEVVRFIISPKEWKSKGDRV